MKDTINRFAADAGFAGGGAAVGQAAGGGSTALIIGILAPIVKELIFRWFDKKKAKNEPKKEA